MNDQAEQAEDTGPAELALRKALAEAIQGAQGNNLMLDLVLTTMSDLVGRMICSVPGYNDRRAACSIFHCQMVDAIMEVEEAEENGTSHDPDTCPDCIAAGRGEGRTVQ